MWILGLNSRPQGQQHYRTGELVLRGSSACLLSAPCPRCRMGNVVGMGEPLDAADDMGLAQKQHPLWNRNASPRSCPLLGCGLLNGVVCNVFMCSGAHKSGKRVARRLPRPICVSGVVLPQVINRLVSHLLLILGSWEHTCLEFTCLDFLRFERSNLFSSPSSSPSRAANHRNMSSREH